jgi:hypothetical protein
LAASARRWPSSVHCGIKASSAPAIRHSSATAWPLASYSGPLFFSRAEREPGDLGQQIAAVPGGLLQLCGSGGFLGFCQAAPPGMPEGDARQAGAEQPAAAGPVMILSHLARIELACGKSKVAILVSAK